MEVEVKKLRCIKIGELRNLTDTELVMVQNRISKILGERRNVLKEEYYDRLQDLLQEMNENGFSICDSNHYYGSFNDSREDFKIYSIDEE